MAEKIEEIKLNQDNVCEFASRKISEISDIVGDKKAINALSGGVDSSTVTMLAHKALGKNLLTFYIENGLMREGELDKVMTTFNNQLGIGITWTDASEKFFTALKGIEDPQEKRKAITTTFYRDVFGKIVQNAGAKYLFQGTILTDVQETVAGIKAQHNVLEQIGINPQKAFGYKVIEPLVQLRKDSVRVLAQYLGLPKSIYNRMPFPGPALAARIIGEVTSYRTALVRKATAILEDELSEIPAFQYLAILHKDQVTGMRYEDGAFKRKFGNQIELRCWNSLDARGATPTDIPLQKLAGIAERISQEIPDVVSVTYNISCKPPSTIEAI